MRRCMWAGGAMLNTSVEVQPEGCVPERNHIYDNRKKDICKASQRENHEQLFCVRVPPIEPLTFHEMFSRRDCERQECAPLHKKARSSRPLIGFLDLMICTAPFCWMADRRPQRWW